MIFIKLDPANLGSDPIMGYSAFLDGLIIDHTDNVFEAFQQCVPFLHDGEQQFKLDDEITRYADTNIIVYGFEEKIDPDMYYIGVQATSAKGHEQLSNIVRDIRRSDAYRGRDMSYMLVGVVSEEPQCLPCMKKKIERHKQRLNKGDKIENTRE